MAIFRITNDTSRFTSTTLSDAFNDDTPAADTLIVDPSGFLIAVGPASFGAYLAPTGAWKVTINGSVFSQTLFGILLNGGNPASSSITIGSDGEVAGTRGIYAESSATINNAGVVRGTSGAAIQVYGTGTRTSSIQEN